MTRLLPRFLTLTLLLLALALTPLAAFAQAVDSDNEDPSIDDAAPVTRVARLSFVDGDVSFLRAGVTDWAPGVENLPLLTGDQIFAGSGARAELQLGRGNYIRLAENTTLTITDLSDSARFEITQGTAIIHVERLPSAFRRYEIDTPNSAILIQKDGLYRVNVRSESDSQLIVRAGQAEVSTDEGSFRVSEGRDLLVDTGVGGKLELAFDSNRDNWDEWSYNRDSTIASTSIDLAPSDVNTYETTNNDFYGASDLSSYGTWTNYSSYGQCWIPRVSSDWAPYRTGQWIWIPSAGWTWLASEPWGWAPYHYGRWSYLSGLGWAWIPGFGAGYRGYGYRDYHWRPAVCGFVNYPGPRGTYVGWYPLAPGERWRRPDRGWHGINQPLSPIPSPRDGRGGFDRGRLPATPRREMTILPVEAFNRGGDRSVRPVAPGRDMSEWINKGARTGLPEIRPNPVAVAPTLGENDRRKWRGVAVPSNEIIRRAVVTRNPSEPTQVGPSRERRLITERGPASIDPTSNRGLDRRPGSPADAGTGSATPRMRVSLPAQGSDVRGNGRDQNSARQSKAEILSRSEEPRGREGTVVPRVPRQEQTGSADNNPVREERRREKQQLREQSRSDNQGQSGQEGLSERKQPPTQPLTENQDQPKQEHHQERQQRPEQPRAENQERHQERQQRQEQPRTENHEQARQEHQQEKQQRQEQRQQQDSRKKP